jgi:deoxyribonuclease V
MPWPRTIAEAHDLQQRLRSEILTEDRLGTVRVVAGVDAWTEPRSARVWAAAVALNLADLELLESAIACRETTFPYRPGYLTFHEAPAALVAIEHLRATPDLIFVDGQGLAHPRRFGLACHIGLLTGIPTIGVAKSRLTGQWHEPGSNRGDWTPLTDRGETIGAVVRTRSRVRCVFVSVGHRIGLPTAIHYTLRCAPFFRLPEPIRLADHLSRVFA